MPNGLGGENHTLHFVCPTSRMHFVYSVLGVAEAHVLPPFQHVTHYIKRRYGLKVVALHGDNETAVKFGNGFSSWVVEKGFLIEGLLLILKAKMVMRRDLGG